MVYVFQYVGNMGFGLFVGDRRISKFTTIWDGVFVQSSTWCAKNQVPWPISARCLMVLGGPEVEIVSNFFQVFQKSDFG